MRVGKAHDDGLLVRPDLLHAVHLGGGEGGDEDGEVDEEEKALMGVWGMMDRDGSGFLSEDETRAVFNAMGYGA